MNNRIAWAALTIITIDGCEYIRLSDAAAYLGMKRQSLANHLHKYAIEPTRRFAGISLFSQSYLDDLDSKRKAAGRPVRSITAHPDA